MQVTALCNLSQYKIQVHKVLDLLNKTKQKKHFRNLKFPKFDTSLAKKKKKNPQNPLTDIRPFIFFVLST